jgi:hypothetical protein
MLRYMHHYLFFNTLTRYLSSIAVSFISLELVFGHIFKKKKDDETPVEGALTPYPGLARFLTL